MMWQGNSLISAAGTTIAEHTSDGGGVLRLADGTTIDVHHSAGSLRWEVTGETVAADGAAGAEGAAGTDGAARAASRTTSYSVRMQGFGVGTLIARCGSRVYRLRRDGVLGAKRSIVDASGVVVAMTSPRARMDLSVEQKRELPLGDLAFMTWALTLVDTPARTTKI